MLPELCYNLKVFGRQKPQQHLFCLLLAGFDKVKMYGFYIRACTDGGCNFTTYAIVALDKAASTLFNLFHKATTTFGHPLRLTADMCFEATGIGQDMIRVHGLGVYLTGPSSANQARASMATKFAACAVTMCCPASRTNEGFTS